MLVLDEVTLCAESSGLALDRVREFAAFAREQDQPLVQVLLEKGKVDERELLSGLATRLGLSFVDHNGTQIPPDALAQVSPALATRHQAIPLSAQDGRLKVACSEPNDWRGWDDLAHFRAQ